MLPQWVKILLLLLSWFGKSYFLKIMFSIVKILCDYFLSQKEYIIKEGLRLTPKLMLFTLAINMFLANSCCACHKKNIFVIGDIGFISRTWDLSSNLSWYLIVQFTKELHNLIFLVSFFMMIEELLQVYLA